MRPAIATLALLTCAAAGGAFLGIRNQPKVILTDALVVSRTSVPIKIDGELDEASWVGNVARTGAFAGKPYSDARMLWDDGFLYVALYAADEDIETRATEHDGPLWMDDAFRLVFDIKGTEYRIDVSPKCILSDGRGAHGKVDYAWNSGARVACDTDGTINEPNDEDEEWIVEMAVPLQAIGVEHDSPFQLSIERCDKPKHEPRSCTSWSKQVVLR